MNKYGKGWFYESNRHRLARLGIKTGRKVNFSCIVKEQVFEEPLHKQICNDSLISVSVSKKYPKGLYGRALSNARCYLHEIIHEEGAENRCVLKEDLKIDVNFEEVEKYDRGKPKIVTVPAGTEVFSSCVEKF